MNSRSRLAVVGLALACLVSVGTGPLEAQLEAQVEAQGSPASAGLPALLTSCGQSPGPERVRFFLRRLEMEHEFLAQVTAEDLVERQRSGNPFKAVVIVTGASLKGMGAAGVSMREELDRTAALIDEAKRQGLTIIGAHVEGMALRAYAWEVDSLVELGTKTNSIFCRDGLPNRFATLVYLDVPCGSGTVKVLNAGHPPPIVVRAAESGRTDTLPPVAMPLGIRPGAIYLEQSFDLAPGDVMLVYSDGLPEATNEAGEFFDDERVRNLLPDLLGVSADTAGQRILASVHAFVGEQRPYDDLSLAILRRT